MLSSSQLLEARTLDFHLFFKYSFLFFSSQVVLVSAEPWHGAPRDVQPTLALLARFLAQPRFATRLSVVPGLWASEEAQRAFGNAFLRALPAPKTAAGSPSGAGRLLFATHPLL